MNTLKLNIVEFVMKHYKCNDMTRNVLIKGHLSLELIKTNI
jgi:hypothetical protein